MRFPFPFSERATEEVSTFFGVARILLFGFVFKLQLAALEIRTGNNGVIDAGDNLLDYGIRLEDDRQSHQANAQI